MVRVRVTEDARRLPAVLEEPDRRNGKFTKGKGGRPAGAHNRTTTLIKDAILAAGTNAGEKLLDDAIRAARREWRKAKRLEFSSEDRLYAELQKLKEYREGGPDGLTHYLTWMALNEPKSFAPLLGKVLPFHLTAKVDHSHREYNSKDEIMDRLKESGVPVHMLQN